MITKEQLTIGSQWKTQGGWGVPFIKDIHQKLYEAASKEACPETVQDYIKELEALNMKLVEALKTTIYALVETAINEPFQQAAIVKARRALADHGETT